MLLLFAKGFDLSIRPLLVSPETGLVPPLPALRNSIPTKINSIVSDLKLLTWAEYRSHKSTQWLIDQQQVGELDFVYRMTITRGQGIPY